MANCAHYQICGREADGNDAENLCILHSKSRNKVKEAFCQALADHRNEKGDNFKYFVFPGDTDFSDATFSGEADFRDATFRGKADFRDATFSGKANFVEARFSGDADFERATFSGDASFMNATFSGRPDFHGATFSGDADFRHATFSEIANFQMATFKGYADFRGATFRTYADFDRATFGEDHNSSSATHFSRDAGFSNTTFSGDADFHEATFNGKADFLGATFSGEADFRESTFSGDANFLLATFSGDANFLLATFSGDVLFWGIKFSGDADFWETKFSGNAQFEKATFAKDTDFTSAQFAGKTNFNRSRFKARALFLDIKANDQSTKTQISPGVEVDFRNVIIDQPDALIFRDVDMRKWRFLGTDLRKAEFTGVTWPEIGGWPWPRIRGRVGVYDEVASIPMDQVRDFAGIERLYRELKQNFEDRRDSDRAGDFHYGEKEMRRLNRDTPLVNRALLFLYRLFSGYGERYLLPLRWATGLFLLGTWVHYVHVISPTDAGQSLVWPNFSEWGRAAIHTVRAMFLLKPTGGAPTGVLADGVSTALSLLGPLFLGLLALAIRQRLRR